jgi:hypothetical protein
MVDIANCNAIMVFSERIDLRDRPLAADRLITSTTSTRPARRIGAMAHSTAATAVASAE